jgi:hypothetical protein
LNAYLDSRERAGEMAIESSVVGRHLLAMLALRVAASEGQPAPPFTGTSTTLLGELDAFMRMVGRARPQGWPNTPHGMGRALHRIAPALRKLGYEVTFERTPGTGERVVTITPPPPRPGGRDMSDISDVPIPTPTGAGKVFVEQKVSPHPAEAGNERHKRHERHTRPNGPEPQTIASVPFMITRQMRADLRARGFSDAQIGGMTPVQAHEHLKAERSAPEAPKPTTRSAANPSSEVSLMTLCDRAAAVRGAAAVWAVLKRHGIDNPSFARAEQQQAARPEIEALLNGGA